MNFNNVFLSFLAGIILNFMPCVLPVLSLKIYDIIKYSQTNKNKKNLRLISLASICGNIFIFSIFAFLTIIFKKTGEIFHVGFHFQNPYLLTTIIILLFLFFLNSLNFFHLNYHPKIIDFIQKKYNNTKTLKIGIFIENFITSICMVLFALPCCIPIFGSLTTLSLLNNNNFYIFLNFIFVSIGMSTPFLLIQLKPTILDFLKKKKFLLNILNKTISILILITIIWFIKILLKQIGNISTIIFILFLLIIPIQFKIVKKQFHNFILVLLISIFAINTSISYFKEEQAKEISKTLWKTDINVKKIQQYINEDKTIFINIMANWCVICNINEITILSNKDVVNFLNNDFILPIKLDITTNDKKADYFFNNKENFAVPTYIIYNKKCKNGNFFSGGINKNKIFKEFEKCGVKKN